METENDSFTDEQITEFQEAFNLFPQEKKGCIDIELLETALKALGHHPTPDDMQYLYKHCEGCEGKLTFSMFLSAMALLVAACSKDEIRAAFGMFDKDGNGTIDSRELRDVMLNLGEALTDEEKRHVHPTIAREVTVIMGIQRAEDMATITMVMLLIVVTVVTMVDTTVDPGLQPYVT